MHSIEQVKECIGGFIEYRASALADWGRNPALLGSIPELDSMAIVTIISGLEEHFNIEIHDDEINASIFETVGSLAAFVDRKCGNNER